MTLLLNSLSLFFCSSKRAGVARSASLACATNNYVGILGCVFVAPGAVRLTAHVDSGIPTFSVYSLRDRLKVLWIDATRNAAFVIKNQFVRDRANKKTVRDAMGARCEAHFSTKLSVSQGIAMCEPQPAASVRLWRNFVKKSFYYGSSHVTPFSRIGQAHETLRASLWAVPILQHNSEFSSQLKEKD